MIDFLKYRIFSPIMSTEKYEKTIAVMESNCKKIGEILESEAYNRFVKLKEYVESGQCKNDIAVVKNQKYKNSAEYEIEKKLKLLAKSKKVKKFILTGSNSESIEVGEYLRLKQIFETDEYKEKKTYLCDIDKHKKCSAYKNLEDYNYLKKSEDVNLLPKLQKSCKKYVAEMSKWKGTFGDDFSSVVLERKWVTQPVTALRHLQKSYSQLGDLQFISDGNNINVTNSLLQIITRNESANGFVWSEKHGFVPQKFSYTSGIASTATIFMQTYGRIEAKVRMPKTKRTYHAFWLGCEQMLPFINIFCVNNGKVQVGAFNNSQSITKKIHVPLNQKFYVVGIEWNTSEIIWKINGKKVFSAEIRINEQMYLAFSSGVKKGISNMDLPISFDVDWVKCYKHK
ncbi:MAG: glycoside hydrolase family 16 protein [Prevotellaceae bacterium]|nr:glycoside hydrolase family 16 protein [Prevotellaceae bacterium]